MTSFDTFVDTKGRQLKKSGQEFVPLSALRILVATSLHGRRGIQQEVFGECLQAEDLIAG